MMLNNIPDECACAFQDYRKQAEDVHKLVFNFSNKINFNIAPGRQVETSGAGSRRDREIIIKFTNSAARIRHLRGRAKLWEDRVKNVFINEDLTPSRKMLAYECRKIQRINNSNIKKTWLYAGYPHILDGSGKKLNVTCISDLDSSGEWYPAAHEFII